MKGYLYSEITKEYLTEYTLQKDKLESKISGKDIYMMPNNCTLKEPLPFEKGEKLIFDGEDWTIIPKAEKEEKIKEKPENTAVMKEEQMIYKEMRRLAIKSLGDKLSVIKE
jgi:hypothetical protein